MVNENAGVYIPTSDALDSLLLPEDLWELEPERAIALVTVREMFLKRGEGLIGDDVKRVAGSGSNRFDIISSIGSDGRALSNSHFV